MKTFKAWALMNKGQIVHIYLKNPLLPKPIDKTLPKLPPLEPNQVQEVFISFNPRR